MPFYRSNINQYSFFTRGYFVMPILMLNKDFIKLLFQEKKKLLKKKDTIPLKPPCFDELSVARLYNHVVSRPGMAPYFPDSYPKGR